MSSIKSDTFKEEKPLESKSADDDSFEEVDEGLILLLADNTLALYPSLPSSLLLTLQSEDEYTIVNNSFSEA